MENNEMYIGGIVMLMFAGVGLYGILVLKLSEIIGEKYNYNVGLIYFLFFILLLVIIGSSMILFGLK